MLENRAESPASGAPMKMGIIILYKRNKGAVSRRARQPTKVYSETASTQAEQSNGERLSVTPVVHRGFRSN